MTKKKSSADKPEDGDEPKKAKPQRDFSQRAHDMVREVEKRHQERHKND